MSSSIPPSSVVALKPMAMSGGGVDDLLPEAALGVAFAVLHEVQQLRTMSDTDSDESDEEQPPRVKRTRKKHKRRDIETCAWAQLLRDEELKDSTTKTAKQFRQDFLVP